MCQSCHEEVEEVSLQPLDPMMERIATLSYQFGFEQGRREAAEQRLKSSEYRTEQLAKDNEDLRESIDSIKQARDSYISRANHLEEENIKLKKRRTRR